MKNNKKTKTFINVYFILQIISLVLKLSKKRPNYVTICNIPSVKTLDLAKNSQSLNIDPFAKEKHCQEKKKHLHVFNS